MGTSVDALTGLFSCSSAPLDSLIKDLAVELVSGNLFSGEYLGNLSVYSLSNRGYGTVLALSVFVPGHEKPQASLFLVTHKVLDVDNWCRSVLGYFCPCSCFLKGVRSMQGTLFIVGYIVLRGQVSSPMQTVKVQLSSVHW